MDPRAAVIATAIEANVFFMDVEEQGIAANKERQDARLFCTGFPWQRERYPPHQSCEVN
jgi:hypothetical protein